MQHYGQVTELNQFEEKVSHTRAKNHEFTPQRNKDQEANLKITNPRSPTLETIYRGQEHRVQLTPAN